MDSKCEFVVPSMFTRYLKNTICGFATKMDCFQNEKISSETLLSEQLKEIIEEHYKTSSMHWSFKSNTGFVRNIWCSFCYRLGPRFRSISTLGYPLLCLILWFPRTIPQVVYIYALYMIYMFIYIVYFARCNVHPRSYPKVSGKMIVHFIF